MSHISPRRLYSPRKLSLFVFSTVSPGFGVMSFISASAAARYPTTLLPEMKPLDSTGMISMPYFTDAALLTAMMSSPIMPVTQVA